ncbi:MAG: hypothetical protein KDB36_18375 [Acidimicrobiales bacterium]|nr:hypothetical protein [Acidimicrobiales bacterium]
MGRYAQGPYDNVEVGTILFTLVEPHRGQEVAYNRWYERDHFYAGCMIGRSWFAGGRWVATAPLKAARFPATSPFLPDVSTGSYLATYWVEKGQDAEAIAWGSEQVHWLHANDRMFEGRDHIHTLMYVHRWSYQRDEDGVPPALALDHGFPGVVAVMVDRDGDADARGFSGWLVDDCLPAAIGADSAIELVVAATPIPLPEGAPVFQPDNPGQERRTLLLCFVDRDPAEAMASVHALAEAIDAGAGTVSYAAPFLATVPGTDTYTDQLW